MPIFNKPQEYLEIKQALIKLGFKFNFLGTQVILATKVPGINVTVQPQLWQIVYKLFTDPTITSSFYYNEIIDLIQNEVNK